MYVYPYRLTVKLLGITLMIAGCATAPQSSQDKDVLVDKIPVLGDIPLLGCFFRSVSHNTRQATTYPATNSSSASPQLMDSMVSYDQNDIPVQLEKLKELKYSGLISEDDYKSQRKRVLEKL